MSTHYDKYNEIIRYVSKEIREILMKVNSEKVEHFEEIRLRTNKPLILQNYYEDWFINDECVFRFIRVLPLFWLIFPPESSIIYL